MIAGSQSFIDAMIAPIARVHARVDLLDKQERFLKRLDGSVKELNFSADSKRDVRSEFSLTLINNGDFTWSVGGEIWIDKRIKLWIGLETPTGAISYVPRGVFLLEEAVVDSKSQEAYFAGGDKWKLFDGSNRGKFTDTTTILKNVPIFQAIMDQAQTGGETNFAFENCATLVPYDLPYQMTDARGKAMKDLAAAAVYDLFYDFNGFLRFRPLLQDVSTVASCWTYDTSQFTLYAGARKSFDSANLYNKVVVVGGSSQTATVSAVAVNNDPNNPISTVNIGERIFHYNNGSPEPLIVDVPHAQYRADYELGEHSKLPEKHEFECWPNYLHEPGDVITIIDSDTGTSDKFELVRFSIGLRPDGGGLMTGEATRVRKVT
ncbi:hypothetical protein [Tumebacillus permanentifrigoris]|uniref:Uncharacterized protein n=1 Tax=Tumebacillus permanentifrigoris TaxID=378543 RepID=A0A316D4U5_9BACL|nr:hypothetical protein [Tumebacillus permanentifrigoris]PWK07493.1 hypothetical protein C7459_11792 [Tumebacillus permanentifrigoris]